MTETVLLPLAGGALIGLAAGALLVLSGRIAGISGILGGLLERPSSPGAWRIALVAGLFAGGALLALLRPSSFPSFTLDSKTIAVLIGAGLLVGFGTRLGSGCTSGHGVCGVARFSKRSVAATVTFCAFGALTVIVARAAGI